MLTSNPSLQRTLRPLTTPQAAARMAQQHLTGIAVTTATLGVLWWTTFFEVWQQVMFPPGAHK